MSLLGLVLPFWAKYAAVGALVAASCAFTYSKTAAHYADEMELQRLRVEKVGAAQNARTALQLEQQKRITEGVVNGWDQMVKDARGPFSKPVAVAPRMRVGPAAGSGLLPPVPISASGADASCPDDRLADAAETTLMLVKLQEWIRLQQAVMP